VLVETPTYLGALQAFAPMEPEIVSVASDEHGVCRSTICRRHAGGRHRRFLYVLPNFQNPTGRTMSEERRRAALVARCERSACPSSRTTPMATCGSTSRRRRP
jgi:2-aminoadipate transaminase